MKTYMTVDSFIDAYSKGMRETLKQSLGNGDVHIEDLTAWTVTYGENIFSFVFNMCLESIGE